MGEAWGGGVAVGWFPKVQVWRDFTAASCSLAITICDVSRGRKREFLSFSFGMGKLESLLCVVLGLGLVVGLELNVQVMYNGSPSPQSMYLRGDGLGLNWNEGVVLAPSNSTPFLWTGVFSYSSASVGSK